MNDTRPSLILRVQDRENEDGWTEFVGLYQPMLVRFAIREGLSESDADDVAQDILVKLLRLMPEFQLDPAKRFRGWLSRMVYCGVMTWHRQRQGKERVHEAIREDELKRQLLNAGEPSQEWCSDHRRRVLAYAMEQVHSRCTPVKWNCFVQHILLRRPAAEVAHELGIKENLAFVNASRVLKEVRALCREYDEELGDG